MCVWCSSVALVASLNDMFINMACPIVVPQILGAFGNRRAWDVIMCNHLWHFLGKPSHMSNEKGSLVGLVL